MPSLRRPSRICGTAAAASSRSTVIRTSSEPARDSAATCSTVLATSAVSVLVIDCTTIGAPSPTATFPTMTRVVPWRARGPAMSDSGSFSGLFMGPRISGFVDSQQWISRNRHHRAGSINQKKPCNYKDGRYAKHGGQGVMHNEIASYDAKQRGDEAEGRQFAGRVKLYQREPQRERGSNHPCGLVDQKGDRK